MLHFRKMLAEDDFVIFDGRENKLQLSQQQISTISDRKRGVGCDKIGIMRHSQHWQEMTHLETYDANGVAKPCENIVRCVADILMTEDGTDNVIVETSVGSVNCWKMPEGLIKVEWPADDAPIHMTGPVSYGFEGEILLSSTV